MGLILSLETSAEACSVALHKNGQLLQELIVNESQAHASRLAPLIDQILSSQATAPSSLQAVAVSSGPGSYTGLRIGASTAKGMCYALNIPLISVPTLEHLALGGLSNSTPADVLLCPMMDARRMEVYCQVFDRQLQPRTDVEALVVDEFSFSELLAAHKMLFFGSGAAKSSRVIGNPNAIFLESVLPSARALGELASRKFDEGAFEDVNSFKPFYLKEFEAKKARPLL
jgi:tRNA threonylcarbamoyladenosine biosynthesis protein TsaB